MSRFAFALLTLTLMTSCLRFGYTPDVPSTDGGGADAGSRFADVDAALQSPADAGPIDAGASVSTPCLVNVTTNTYSGSPHFHGYLALRNAGLTTWSLITIEFDLRSSTYICNDQSELPGAGWTLQSSSGHCVYTKTAPSLSLAPGATLTFEYSTSDPLTDVALAAENVSVSGCM